MQRSRFLRVHQLDMKDHVIRNIPRAGVIFYTFIPNGALHMCYGRDRRSGDLTDFGGCRMEKINETPIRCAVREGNEESRCAFSEITLAEQVQGFFCLYSSKMLIIFIPVISPNEMDIREITSQNFNDARFLTTKQRKDRRYNEISEIVWLNESQINNLFSKRPAIQMFAKVRRFIYSCNQLSQNICVMKKVLESVVTDNPQSYSIDDIQKVFVNQITRTLTPQEELIDAYNYHTWNQGWILSNSSNFKSSQKSFDESVNSSPRHDQSCSLSLYGSLSPSKKIIITDTISVNHQLIQTIHLTC